MSNTKFTEGKWELELETDIVNMALKIDGKCVMCDDPHEPWVPENKYDWYLMAQSKNMYEALQSLSQYMAFQGKPDWTQEINILLAKARGEV